ncbi:putative histone acetyltransferase subunit (Yaf9) [Paramyrothecium foliicola]|nr:putative histone acetyltransferase subunit (Yaf9) [Paramyrothecium foliicola]
MISVDVLLVQILDARVSYRRERFAEAGDGGLLAGNDALVVSLEQDAHAVDNVVGALEQRRVGGRPQDVTAFPAHLLGKRVKLTQVRRPFVVGSTALPFSDSNPRPPGVPDNHTHSWQVFVKGLDDTDITYWLRRVQFKLHESIPNYRRSYRNALTPKEVVEGEPGKPFVVDETGWGEFDITVKLYYVNDSGEKPQTLYHYLRLHPYGRTEEEKQAMITENGEVRSWSYEEQLFNEPYEAFFQLLTAGAVPKGWKPAGGGAGGKGKGKGKNRPPPPLPDPNSGEVWEHSAMIPSHNRPGQPFSRETEAAEIKKLQEAQKKTEDMCKQVLAELKDKEELLAKLKAENAAAAAASKPA